MVSAFIGGLLLAAAGCGDLESGFVSPPPSARPHVWYHLMNGNVTKEGVTRDFEALAEAGFGGVQMFDAGCGIPPGGLDFKTPAWFDFMRHAAAEARRLGLEICVPNCSGWSSSGGPWNPPSNAMKRVVFTETKVRGPAKFGGRLPRETKDNGFYEDIAVLAFPVPPAEIRTVPPATLTTDLKAPSGAAGRLADGRAESVIEMNRYETGRNVLTLSYPEPVTAACVEFQLSGGERWSDGCTLAVEASSDGKTFGKVAERTVVLTQSGRSDESIRTLPLDRPCTFVALRFRFEFNRDWVGRDTFFLGELTPAFRRRIANVAAKTFAVRQAVSVDPFPAQADQVIPRETVRDLTDRMRPDGSLEWDVPDGEWTVLRIGYVCNGVRNHPASRNGCGLEVDKLSAAAMDYHFEQYVGRLCRELGPLAGKVMSGFNNILVDSFEVGSQNWTQGFEGIFRRRRGYDLRPYLPVFAGHVVGGIGESERFLEDFRRVVADLFAENYAGALAAKCRQYGLLCSIEPYGNCPADNLQYGRYADIPMGEFWSNVVNPHAANDGNAKFVSSVAHVWGKPICATESFTAAPGPKSGRWMTTPFHLKHRGDLAFSDGVNRLIYHRFAHQPWADDRYLPGMTMGRWGMHLDRTQTWWPYAKPFFRYQARCQHMLQRGTFVADVLFFAGEEAPNEGGNTDGGSPKNREAFALPAGYDRDICPTDAMYALTVDGGEVVTPGGVRYSLLAIPSVEAMSPRMVSAIAALRRKGANVVWAEKPVRAPGLSGGPAADAEVRRLADDAFAAGVLRMSPAQALARLGVPRRIEWRELPKDVGRVDWIHRREGGTEWFFVAMGNREPVGLDLSFRVTGKEPEIWDAETGTRTPARVWRQENGRTVVRVPFGVCGSQFVVFRKPTEEKGRGEADTRVLDDLSEVLAVEGPWEVRFPNGFVPNPMAKGADERAVFDGLVSWCDRPEDGIRYFSGTATYRKRVALPASLPIGARLFLELGDVREVAEVTVNGRTFDALWHPPFRVDITDAVDGPSLDLSIRVANLWANRLIGDDRQFAPDCEWTGSVVRGTKEIGIREIPAWVREGRPSPTGRHTFTTWKHWDKDDELLPSGLIGPVRLLVATGR